MQHPKSFNRFAKHLFLLGKVYVERNKAVEEIYDYLEKMRKSIIKMRLSYKDIDRLKEKINNLVNWERKYSRLFMPDDNETQELKNNINALEQELKKERQEKERIINENREKISQLTESLSSIKSRMNHLFMEKAKRHHRLRAIEQKINEKVDVHSFYHS